MRPLAEDQSDTPSGCVDQNGVTLFHVKHASDQVLRGHAFQHCGRSRFEGDVFRQADGPILMDDVSLRVGARRPVGVGDAVTDGEASHTNTCCFDDASRLESESGRIGQRVETISLVDVDEVQAYCLVTDANFARAWLRDPDIGEFQNLGPSRAVKADGAHGGIGHRGFLSRAGSAYEIDLRGWSAMMKFKVEAECTPEEARAFLGLPDVTPLNERLVAEMQARMEANITAMQPEELMKSWTAFGLQAQDQFRQMMQAAVKS